MREPLNSMFCPGRPPNTAMVVLWRSFIRVVNCAQVEAQFPLLTSHAISRTIESTILWIRLTDRYVPVIDTLIEHSRTKDQRHIILT